MGQPRCGDREEVLYARLEEERTQYKKKKIEEVVRKEREPAETSGRREGGVASVT